MLLCVFWRRREQWEEKLEVGFDVSVYRYRLSAYTAETTRFCNAFFRGLGIRIETFN